MYENKKYENIKASILSDISGIDKREGSIVNDMVSPVSLELENVYAQFDKMLGVMFLDSSAGEYIDKRASEYGIKRKNGTYATGKCTFSGSKGTEIPKGSLCATSYGLLFETTEVGVIAEVGIIEIPIKATDIGDSYNVLAKEINTIPVSINGVTAVSNSEKTLGGTDIETDDALVERVLTYLQAPATSGNVYHYKLWTMSVEGVGNAKIFPLDNGNGTVSVMPITSGGRSPDEGIIKKVKDYIEEQRPIGATVSVIAPTEVLINVSAKIVFDKSTTLSKIKSQYEEELQKYIKNSVFKLSTVDYYKCLSIFYELEGVTQVTEFKLNDGTSNITISEKQIQVAGTVTIEEAVI